MLHTQPRPTEMQETVFIVDDDEAVRDSLQWLIETEGYQVKTYEDPELFLEQCKVRWAVSFLFAPCLYHKYRRFAFAVWVLFLTIGVFLVLFYAKQLYIFISI